MGWFDALRGRGRDKGLPLYHVVVEQGRAAHWYADARVPDTIDGRFDTIATVLAVALLRLEREAAAMPLAAQLTERFVDDMEGQIREVGIGDVTVGKHMGKMMAMLGGRLGAYRDGFAGGEPDVARLDGALIRNLYRGEHPGDAALARARTTLLAWRDRLEATPLRALIAGEVA